MRTLFSKVRLTSFPWSLRSMFLTDWLNLLHGQFFKEYESFYCNMRHLHWIKLTGFKQISSFLHDMVREGSPLSYLQYRLRSLPSGTGIVHCLKSVFFSVNLKFCWCHWNILSACQYFTTSFSLILVFLVGDPSKSTSHLLCPLSGRFTGSLFSEDIHKFELFYHVSEKLHTQINPCRSLDKSVSKGSKFLCNVNWSVFLRFISTVPFFWTVHHWWMDC